MSYAASTLSPVLSVGATLQTTTPEADELEVAARSLLESGPVGFKVSSRVDAELLGSVRSFVYTLLCRMLPARFRIPPAPAMQRGMFDAWDVALKECRSPDDQILVLPKNRTYSAEELDVEVGCRPRDPADAQRFNTLQAVFYAYTAESDCHARLQASEAYARDLELVIQEATDLFRHTLKSADDG